MRYHDCRTYWQLAAELHWIVCGMEAASIPHEIPGLMRRQGHPIRFSDSPQYWLGHTPPRLKLIC